MAWHCVVLGGLLCHQALLRSHQGASETSPAPWVHTDHSTLQQGKPYGVFGPWYKNWVETLERNSQDHIGDAGTLVANAPSALEHPILAPLFSHVLPTSIPGFKLEEEDQKTMNHIWPVGEHIVEQVLDRFLTSKSRPANFHNPPLQPGAETVGLSASKIGTYGTGRNRVDLDGTSHLSCVSFLIRSRAWY